MSDTSPAQIEPQKDPKDFHHEMMSAEGLIVAELERAGFDPCPAIKIAQEAMGICWRIWGKQAERIFELEATVNHADKSE